MSNVVPVLLRHLDRAERDATVDVVALEAAFTAQLAHARHSWPELALPVADIAAFAAEQLAQMGSEQPLAERIAALRMADLYIAYGCAIGDPAALRAFEARYFHKLGAVLSRFGGEPVADEVRQILREKLLVARPDRRARILELVGKSDLGGLVRIAAVRTAINLWRATRNVELVEVDLLMDSLALDPEAERRLDQRAAAEVKRAFQDTLAELSPRERNVLRMSLLHQLSIDVIGRVHGVHRATAARWLVDIRTQLRAGTRRLLQQRLAMPADAIDSMILLVQSQLDLSFERILDEESPDTDASNADPHSVAAPSVPAHDGNH